MRKLLLAGLFLSCSFISYSQVDGADEKDELAQLRLKKQLVVIDLESQTKNIPYAAVRVFAGYRTASWLWKDGKDDTGRAAEIAAAAIDDHYKNRGEIPSTYFFDSHLFILLDSHAKGLAKQLREKHKGSVNESEAIIRLLSEKDGPKRAVDAAVRLLSRPNEQNPDLVYVLTNLEQQGSPELYRLLGAILAADQTGNGRLPTHMIEILTGFFIKPDVPNEMRKQFIQLVLGRARNPAALSVLDRDAYYRTLQRLWPDISTRYPEMLAEAGPIYTFLSAQMSRSTREANERYERIQNSADKLAATVAEAERAEDKIEKYALYTSAARLALEKKRFVYAVDLMEKASEIDIPRSGIKAEFSKNLHDQFYRSVVTKALEASEPHAAEHAIKKMQAPMSKAEALKNLSQYHIDGNDLDSGRRSHDEAVKLVGNIESSPQGASLLLSMLPTAHRIDSGRLLELTQMIAKTINAIPSLNVEDKPDTKNYREYVTKVMDINWNLDSALRQLVKVNRGAAKDLADRIEKKEIKIIADQVLLIDSVTSTPQPEKSAGSATLP